jgi:hypothetical protein
VATGIPAGNHGGPGRRGYRRNGGTQISPFSVFHHDPEGGKLSFVYQWLDDFPGSPVKTDNRNLSIF